MPGAEGLSGDASSEAPRIPSSFATPAFSDRNVMAETMDESSVMLGCGGPRGLRSGFTSQGFMKLSGSSGCSRMWDGVTSGEVLFFASSGSGEERSTCMPSAKVCPRFMSSAVTKLLRATLTFAPLARSLTRCEKVPSSPPLRPANDEHLHHVELRVGVGHKGAHAWR